MGEAEVTEGATDGATDGAVVGDADGEELGAHVWPASVGVRVEGLAVGVTLGAELGESLVGVALGAVELRLEVGLEVVVVKVGDAVQVGDVVVIVGVADGAPLGAADAACVVGEPVCPDTAQCAPRLARQDMHWLLAHTPTPYRVPRDSQIWVCLSRARDGPVSALRVAGRAVANPGVSRQVQGG